MLNRRKLLGAALAATAACFLRRRGEADTTGLEAAASYSARHNGVSFLVMRDGRPLYADYPRSSATAAHELASGTKSFWGIAACVAQERGLLALDERVDNTVVEWKKELRGAISIRQLLTLTSGLEGGPIGRPPSYKAALETVATAAAGQSFQYGPAPFQVFGEILRRKTGQDPLVFLHQHVLKPAGVQYSSWRRDADGMPHLPSGAALTAADWGRFGVWVSSQTERFAVCFQGSKANPAYGLTWWLNRAVQPGVAGRLSRPMRSLMDIHAEPLIPADLVLAGGAGDQRLYLIPSRKLVVVRQADKILRSLMIGSSWSDREFLRLLLPALV